MLGDRFREQTDSVPQLRKINVNSDEFQALTDLSLNIGVEELCYIIGSNSAGETTLVDVIADKTRPQSGRTIYDQSISLTTLGLTAITHQGIGRKFQKPTAFEALAVGESLELVLKNNRSIRGSLWERLPGEQRDHIDEILVLLRLDNGRTHRAGLFLYGRKQFLEIGILLV